MPLIESKAHSAEDLVVWRRLLRYDSILAQSEKLTRIAAKALKDMCDFAAAGPCYVGVSWGKDSVVVAHMAQGLGLPLVWVRVEPIANPDCYRVRDAFIDRYPSARYSEAEVHCKRQDGELVTAGAWDDGFDIAVARHGARHISGVRGEESAARRMRMCRWGVSTDNTCAPIGWWKGEDVFAYLCRHDLPIHPAYAMSFGGTLQRNRIRVDVIGNVRDTDHSGKTWETRGNGHGRDIWEQKYYREVVLRLR